MNKLLPILLVVVLSGCGTDKLELIFEDNKYQLHLDLKTIKQNNQMIEFILIQTQKEPTFIDGNILHSDTSKTTVDCNKYMMKKSTQAIYSGPRGTGTKLDERDALYFVQLTKVDKDTPAYHVVDYICMRYN